jgi:hypothetical protein
MLIQSEIVAHFSVVQLTGSDYLAVLAAAEVHGIRGGAIFDAIIAFAAWKENVNFLLTLNKKHFDRISPDRSDVIVEP